MRRLLLILLMVQLPSLATASVLGLAPPEPAASPVRISEDVFARIDELQARRHLDADTHYELAVLYHSTGLAKHLDTVREHCEHARVLEPGHIGALLLECRTLADSGDFASAIRQLEGAAPRLDHVDVHYALGFYRYLRARRIHDFSGFAATRDAFLRAARADRRSGPALRSLGAAAILARDVDAAIAATSALIETDPDDGAAWLLRACALAEAGRDAEAGGAFRLGFEKVPAAILQEFATGAGLLTDANGEALDPQVYWRVLDPHPTRPTNRRQMEFWTRMIQADLLFGSLDQAGWVTPPGEAWVRWGPPSASTYVPADLDLFEARTTPGPSSGPDAERPDVDLHALSSDVDPNLHRSFWTWSRGKASFSMVFLDGSFNFHWSLSNGSLQTRREQVQRAPVLFVAEAPELQIGLEVATVVFWRSASVLDLETIVEVDVPAGFVLDAEPLRVDWSVFDAQGELIDTKQVLLGDEHRRSEILHSLGLPLEEHHDPYVTQIAAYLPPGNYHVAVELTHQGTGQSRSRTFWIELEAAGSDLALSDLQFASSWVEVGSIEQAPVEFVKHAHAVVPRLNATVFSGQEHVYLYFEAYNLQTDDAGQTHFDVTYEVFSAKTERPERTASTAAHRQAFVGERTAVSGYAAVIKGTQLDLGELRAGSYLLRVTVVDHHAGREVVSEAPFFVVVAP